MGATRAEMRVGVAGWSIPRAVAGEMPGDGSALQRYSTRFDAAEINSSFHRPHRPATYARWAESVTSEFRFAVKLPKTITHQRKLVDCDALLETFATEIAGLGERRGPLLVQLPPSLAFDGEVAQTFFRSVHALLGGQIVCEPRNPSWFEDPAETLLETLRVARVAADPARLPAAAHPGGWRGLAYFRLHGSPAIYRSPYGPERVAEHAAVVRELAAAGVPSWTIFDNTASSAAMPDAMLLREQLVYADGGYRS